MAVCTLANMSRYSRSNDGSSAGCVEPPVDTLSAGRLLLASLLLFIMLPAVRTVMTRVDTKWLISASNAVHTAHGTCKLLTSVGLGCIERQLHGSQ